MQQAMIRFRSLTKLHVNGWDPYQEPVKTGWLKKQGGMMKSWQRRWCVISGDVMYYFQREDETKPLGSILLPGNKVVLVPFNPTEHDKYIFEIVPASHTDDGTDKMRMTPYHETYQFSASSEEERNDWMKVMRKVMFGSKGGAIFGQSLQETMAFEQRSGQKVIPRIVQRCVAFICRYGLKAEGIFRLPGWSLVVQDYRDAYDHGEQPPLNVDTIDVHSVASLLKLYLRELPIPLIPYEDYESYMKLATPDLLKETEKFYDDLSELLSKLPIENYNLLRYLCEFLQKVGKYEDVNKMTHMNLATVFVQSFIRPEDENPVLLIGSADGRTNITYVLISHCEHLFKLDYNDQGQVVEIDQLMGLGDAGEEGTIERRESESGRASKDHNSVRISAQPGELLGIDFAELGLEQVNTDQQVTPSVTQQSPDGSTSDLLRKHGDKAGLRELRSESKRSRSPLESEYYQMNGLHFILSDAPSDEETRSSDDLYESIQSVLREREAKSKLFESCSSLISSTASDTDNIDIKAEEEILDKLMLADISAHSREGLVQHIKSLNAEFTMVRDWYKNELKKAESRVLHMHQKLNLKVAEMAEKLEAEKSATSVAVHRIVEMQKKQIVENT